MSHDPAGDASTKSGTVRVLLVDDHEAIRFGVKSFLAAEGIDVVGEVGTVADALAQVEALDPDVVIMDVRLSDGSGIDATHDIVERFPRTKVIVLSAYEEEEAVMAAIEAGAAGFMVKRSGLSDLAAAVRRVAHGENLIDPAVTAAMLERLRRNQAPLRDERLGRLTSRELDILRHLALGWTNREIALALFLSEKTVKNHVTKVLAKLGVSRRSEAVAYYTERLRATGR